MAEVANPVPEKPPVSVTPDFVKSLDETVKKVARDNRFEFLAKREDVLKDEFNAEVIHCYDLRNLLTGSELTYKISEVELQVPSKEPIENVVKRGLIFTNRRITDARAAAERQKKALPKLVLVGQNISKMGSSA